MMLRDLIRIPGTATETKIKCVVKCKKRVVRMLTSQKTRYIFMSFFTKMALKLPKNPIKKDCLFFFWTLSAQSYYVTLRGTVSLIIIPVGHHWHIFMSRWWEYFKKTEGLKDIISGDKIPPDGARNVQLLKSPGCEWLCISLLNSSALWEYHSTG